MSWRKGLKARLRSALRRREAEARMEEEFRFHLEREIEKNLAAGWGPREARRRAMVAFGGMDRHRESLREGRGVRWLRDLASDLRYAGRSWWKSPVFTLVAVLTLALGIGVNSAVFGVVKSVLVDALPYAAPGELVRIYTRWDRAPTDLQSVSPGAARDFAERLRSFSTVAPFNFSTFDVAAVQESRPLLLSGITVGPTFFPTVGTGALLGRTFTDADAAAAVVILGHEVWQAEFGGDPEILGRTLRIGGSAYEIVGVLPEGFVGPFGQADVWFALDMDAAVSGPDLGRDQHYLGVVGRLAPGVDLASAQDELESLADMLAREHPGTDRGRTFMAVPLRESMVGDTRLALLVLLASSALVLLVTCANLAGALLSRTLSRRKELAVRVALGAARGRLVRQLLAESAVLAAAGAALGLLLAGAGLALLRALQLPAIPVYADLRLDGGTLAATAVVALATAVGFGIAPSLVASRSSPQRTLREEARGASEGRRSQRLRGSLVAVQIAVSLTLLAGAGLLARSLWAITNAPLGFDPRGVLVARVQLPEQSYPTPESRTQFFLELEQRLRGLAGVEAVGSASQLPSAMMSYNFLTIEGDPAPSEARTLVPYMTVTDDYFRTMRIRVLRGRGFGDQDVPDGTPALVISETMARRYWPERDALGARLRVSPHTSERWGVVVGIVEDVPVDPARPVPAAMVYASARQDMYWAGRDFVLRAAGDPLTYVRSAQRQLAELDPELPLRRPARLRDRLHEGLAGRRLPVLLIGAFGGLALVLAALGVYGLFATMAAAREREFGIRIALGSTRESIAALVLRQGAGWMAAGLLGGGLGIAAAGRVLRAFLYGIPQFDPLALTAAIGLLVMAAIVALLAPVRRATRADPIEALR